MKRMWVKSQTFKSLITHSSHTLLSHTLHTPYYTVSHSLVTHTRHRNSLQGDIPFEVLVFLFISLSDYSLAKAIKVEDKVS